MVAGSWGFDPKAFANASFSHSRTIMSSIGEIDTFYAGSIGAGYSLEYVNLDLGLFHSQSPLTKSSAIGGYLGLTYIYLPELSDGEEREEDPFEITHAQVFPSPPKKGSVLFWARLGYLGTSMTSKVLDDGANSGKDLGFTLDVFYPHSDKILLAAGGVLHNYDDTKGFFSGSMRNVNNMSIALAQGTIQGLPRATMYFQVSWGLAQRDTFIPRYSGTEIEYTRAWAHTFDFGWKHQFTKFLSVTPNYEHTLAYGRSVTGFILEVSYKF